MADSEAIIPLTGTLPPLQVAGILMRAATTGKPCNVASFDPSSPLGRVLMVKAMLMDCKPLKEMIGKKIAVVNFLIHEAQSADENGELEEWGRCVVFDKDGEPYQCGARGVIKSLSVLGYARDKLPFDPPIICEVRLKDLGNKKQWLSLVPDLDSLGIETTTKPARNTRS